MIKSVNRQGKRDTKGKKVNGQLGACSCSLEEVEYRLKKKGGADVKGVLRLDRHDMKYVVLLTVS